MLSRGTKALWADGSWICSIPLQEVPRPVSSGQTHPFPASGSVDRLQQTLTCVCCACLRLTVRVEEGPGLDPDLLDVELCELAQERGWIR